MKLNKNATKLFITDAIAAPFTPNAGFGTNIKLNINFNATPINDVIAGTIILPNPCNAPFVVCIRTANIIVKENICSKNPPSVAFGNNKLIIGCANTIIPNVQGSPIIIVVNNENDILLLAVRVSFFVINADTDGTSAVANAILNDNGSVASVSTFPDNIPYCAFATESGKNFFNPFTTVTMSTILDNVDIIALSVIGIETTKILFTILFTLSCL